MHGLGNVASALNASDQCLARIAALHLEISDLPDEAAREAMEAVDILLKSADWNPALHPRRGTSPTPGWFATTEGAPTGSSPIRTAQNNNSMSDGSHGGSRPGDPFSTAATAAMAALLSAYAISQSTNLEYAGSQMLGTISNGSFVPNPTYDPNLKPSTQSPGGDSYDPDRDDKPDNVK